MPQKNHRKFPPPEIQENRLWVPRNKDMERMDIGKPLDEFASYEGTRVKLSGLGKQKIT